MANDNPYFMQAAKFVAEVEFDGNLHREIATALRHAHLERCAEREATHIAISIHALLPTSTDGASNG